MSRKNYTSNTIWEKQVGYSRAVQVGNQVFVSGTTAVDENDEVVGVGDMERQTRFIFQKITDVLTTAGGSLKDVVRTRMFVTDISQWEAVGKVHGEFFGEIQPAATMVQVSALIDPELLIEIEVDAVLQD